MVGIILLNTALIRMILSELEILKIVNAFGDSEDIPYFQGQWALADGFEGVEVRFLLAISLFSGHIRRNFHF